MQFLTNVTHGFFLELMKGESSFIVISYEFLHWLSKNLPLSSVLNGRGISSHQILLCDELM